MQVKAFLADPSSFVVESAPEAGSGGGGGGAAEEKKEEAKAEEEEEEEDDVSTLLPSLPVHVCVSSLHARLPSWAAKAA